MGGSKWTCLGLEMVGSHGQVTHILSMLMAGVVLSNDARLEHMHMSYGHRVALNYFSALPLGAV